MVRWIGGSGGLRWCTLTLTAPLPAAATLPRCGGRLGQRQPAFAPPTRTSVALSGVCRQRGAGSCLGAMNSCAALTRAARAALLEKAWCGGASTSGRAQAVGATAAFACRAADLNGEFSVSLRDPPHSQTKLAPLSPVVRAILPFTCPFRLPRPTPGPQPHASPPRPPDRVVAVRGGRRMGADQFWPQPSALFARKPGPRRPRLPSRRSWGGRGRGARVRARSAPP